MRGTMRAHLFVALAAVSLVACKQATADSTKPAAATAAAPAVAAVAPGAKAELGKAAPDFTLTDLDGNAVKLSSFKGKTVVLEWFNPGCPFVKQNHVHGPLKDMAARVTPTGVVWLSINSAAQGKQGHGKEENVKGRDTFGMKNPILLDESGDVGHAYGAKSTPHMFVIDKEGTLVYRGAIDNAPDGDPRGSDKVINYVDAALADLAAGRPVAQSQTDSYGCSVKYASK